MATSKPLRAPLPALARDFRVIGVDALFHGFSSKEPWVDGAPTPPIQAEAYVDLLHALGYEKAIYEGESMGAAIGVEIAMRYPETLDRLVLNGFGMVRTEKKDWAKQPNKGSLHELSYKALTDPTFENIRNRLHWLVHDDSTINDEIVQTRQRLYQVPEINAAMRRVFGIDGERPNFFAGQAYSEEDVRTRWETPTLVMFGEFNPMLGPDYGRYCADLAGADFYEFKGVGHWPQWEAPEPASSRSSLIPAATAAMPCAAPIPATTPPSCVPITAGPTASTASARASRAIATSITANSTRTNRASSPPARSKATVDNAFDWYHAPLTHASAFMAGYARGKLMEPGQKVPLADTSKHRVLLGDYGHAISGARIDDEQLARDVEFMKAGKSMMDISWRNSPEAREQLGPVGLHTRGHPNIFPNLWIVGGGTQFCLRLPKGLGKTEAWWFTIAETGLSEEEKHARIMMASHTHGPAGFLEQDDGENWDQSTRGTRGVVARRYPLHFAMGLGHGDITTDVGSPGYIDTSVNEHAQLWAWRSWADWMNADGWDDLKASRTPQPTERV